jgi:hypothetical protein
MTRNRRLPFAGLALLLLASAAQADTFYVVVFGAQSKPKQPKYSHSWATFVRVPGEPCVRPSSDGGPVESFTISWFPQAVTLRVKTPFAEPGRNFDSRATFQIVVAQCEHVSAWGPYQICEDLYCRALGHKQRLEGGEIRYKTIDVTRNTLRVSSCIHALTVFNTENRRLRIGRTNFGDVASYYVTDSYRPWIVDACQTHRWVADQLGLGQYPIRWRTLAQGRPRNGQ